MTKFKWFSIFFNENFEEMWIFELYNIYEIQNFFLKRGGTFKRGAQKVRIRYFKFYKVLFYLFKIIKFVNYIKIFMFRIFFILLKYKNVFLTVLILI